MEEMKRNINKDGTHVRKLKLKIKAFIIHFFFNI